MEVKYYKTYSENLQREVEYKTYGEGGKGVYFFDKIFNQQLRIAA